MNLKTSTSFHWTFQIHGFWVLGDLSGTVFLNWRLSCLMEYYESLSSNCIILELYTLILVLGRALVRLDVNWRTDIYSTVVVPPGLLSWVFGRMGIHLVLEVSFSRIMEVLVLFMIPHSNLSKDWSPVTSFNMLKFTLAGIYNTHVISDYPA